MQLCGVANNPVSWKAEENEPHIQSGLLKSSTLKNLSPNPKNCLCVICMMGQNMASCTESRLSLLPTLSCHRFIDFRLWMPSSSPQRLFFCSKVHITAEFFLMLMPLFVTVSRPPSSAALYRFHLSLFWLFELPFEDAFAFPVSSSMK